MLPLLVVAVLSVVLAGLWYSVYYEEGLNAQRVKEERLAAGFADFALALHRTVSDVTFLIDHDASERTGGAVTVRIDGFDEERMARERGGGILIYDEGATATESISRLLERRAATSVGRFPSVTSVASQTRPTGATDVRVVAWITLDDSSAACTTATPPPPAGECRVRVEFGDGNTGYQVHTQTSYAPGPGGTTATDTRTIVATVRVPLGMGAPPGFSIADPLDASHVSEALFFLRQGPDLQAPPYRMDDGTTNGAAITPAAPTALDGNLGDPSNPVYNAVLTRAAPSTSGIDPDVEAAPAFPDTAGGAPFTSAPWHSVDVEVSAPRRDGSGNYYQEIVLRRRLPAVMTNSILPPETFAVDDGTPRVPSRSPVGLGGTGRGSDHCRAQAMPGANPANHFLAMFCTMFGNQDDQYGTGGAALDTAVASTPPTVHPVTGRDVESDPGGRALDFVIDEAYERYMPGLLAARERLSASVRVRAWLGCRDDGVIRRIESVVSLLHQSGNPPGVEDREGCSFEGGRDPEGNDRSMLLVIWLEGTGGADVSFSQGAVAAALTEYFPDVAPNFVGFGSLAGSEVEYRPTALAPAERADTTETGRDDFSCGFADREIGYETLAGCEHAPSVVGTGQRIGDFVLPDHRDLGADLGAISSDRSDRTTETYSGVQFDRDEFRYPTQVAFYAVIPVLAPPLPLAGLRPGPINTYRNLGVSPGNGLTRGSVTRFSGFNEDPHASLRSGIRDACDKTAPRADATRRRQVVTPGTTTLEDRVEAFGGVNLMHDNEPHVGSARFHLDSIARLVFIDRYLSDPADAASIVYENRVEEIEIGPRAARPRFAANRSLNENRGLPARSDPAPNPVPVLVQTNTTPPVILPVPGVRDTRTRPSADRLGPVRVDALGYFCLVGSSGIAHGDANAITGGGFRSQ